MKTPIHQSEAASAQRDCDEGGKKALRSGHSAFKTAPAIGLVSAMGLGSAVDLEAAIIYSGPLELTITGSQVVYFDLDQSSAGPNYAALTPFAGDDFFLGFDDNVSMRKPYVSTRSGAEVLRAGSYAARLSLDDSISGSGSWTQGNYIFLAYYGDGPWGGGAEGYLGLRLSDGSGGFNYGWASVDFDDGNSITLRDFAINTTTNETITAGAIPEPAALGLLLGGVAGAVAMAGRRRRNEKHDAA